MVIDQNAYLGLDTMGFPELRIIPIPKKALLDMWDALDVDKKTFVEKKLGYLIFLLYRESHVPLVKAMAHFWNPKTSTFVFGHHELTPTLEELEIIIGNAPAFGLVNPPF